MWLTKMADYARSGYEYESCCCCCCCCYVCVLCALRKSCEGCQSTPCAWACCAVCVRRGHTPQSPEHHHFFRWPLASAAKIKQHTEHPRQHAASVVHETLGDVDVASAPCQDSPHDFAGLQRPRVGMASPHGPWGTSGTAWCGANHLPCVVRTYVTWMMPVSCSCDVFIRPGQLGLSWPTRLLFHSKPQKTNPILKFMTIWALSSDLWSCFMEVDQFWGLGE